MRALVLTGGGSFGAFQAGVVHGLAERGRSWDLIIGTSVGAINGAYLAQAAPAEHASRAEALCQMWQAIDDKQVFKSNVRGILHELLPLPFLPYKPALFDTTPLRVMIHREMSATPPPTRLKVTAVSLDTGAARLVDAAHHDIRPWVLASSAIPILFPPVRVDGGLWVDGGVRRNSPIEEAVRAGATEIDVVLCFPLRRNIWRRPVLGKRWSVAEIAGLTLLYIMAEFLNGDVLAWEQHKNPTVRLYAPDDIPVITPITFSRASIDEMLRHGREVAAR